MKKLLVSTLILLLAAASAHATQETLTSAGPLDCSAISYCVQNTSDGRLSSWISCPPIRPRGRGRTATT